MGSEEMKQMNEILMLLPEAYEKQLRAKNLDNLEELRIGSGRPLRLLLGGREEQIWPHAKQGDLEEILRRASRQSVYACNETIRQGFLTVEGGHRIGICGFGVVQNGSVHTIRTPSSLSIRVARQVNGFGNQLLPLLKGSTLLLGPPGSGKTTLLRDIVRQLSDLKHQCIGLVDERGELSASVSGTPQLQIGQRTDVIVNVDKATAVMMLLRTMAPQWIAVDEITAPEDVAALEQAAYCGVRLLATAHGETLDDLQKRPLYRRLMEASVFQSVCLLRRDKTYEIREVTT